MLVLHRRSLPQATDANEQLMLETDLRLFRTAEV